MTNDPKDRHVLAAALVARATTIVTTNLRDFPVRATRPHGVVALTPDDFLTSLLDRETVEAAAHALRRHARFTAGRSRSCSRCWRRATIVVSRSFRITPGVSES